MPLLRFLAEFVKVLPHQRIQYVNGRSLNATDPTGLLGPLVLPAAGGGIAISAGTAALIAAAAVYGISVYACLTTPSCRDLAQQLARDAVENVRDICRRRPREPDGLCDCYCATNRWNEPATPPEDYVFKGRKTAYECNTFAVFNHSTCECR